MKKMSLKIGVSLVLGIGALLLASPDAQAVTPCPITQPPVDSFTCGGVPVFEEQVLACEEPTSENRTVGGCYDTDGDCNLTPYSKLTVVTVCTIGGSDIHHIGMHGDTIFGERC